jgi:DNA polymerase-3 subunit delta
MARAAKPNASSAVPDASMRIVVLTGKDSFLRVERSRQLQEALEAAHGGVDRFDLDGASASLSAVLDELRSYGLMASHKLVIVDNAEQFLAAEDRRRAMERYAERPQPESTLLMRAGSRWNPGKFDKLVEAAGGAVIKCDAPSEQEARAWCAARAVRQHGAELGAGAAELLVEKIGPDLARLDSELAKLAAAAGQGKPVSRALVSEFVGLSREEQAWEIQSVLLREGAPGALRKLNELVRVSGAPEQLVGWSISEIMRKVHDAARLQAQGLDDFAVGKRLRLWGDSQSLVTRAARSLGPRRAAALLAECVRTDARTKSGWSSDTRRTLECLAVSTGGRLA